jgi:ribosomal protein S18 acetylase RimI-like enzyme
MNFYSTDIINEILNTKEDENIIPEIALFYSEVFYLFCNYTNKIVNPKYILTLLSEKTNSIAFRCIDTEFSIKNCPSILIYRKSHDVEKNEMIYYILMICTKRKFKNLGYASSLLDDFITYIKNDKESNINTKIILSSIESAVTFYEGYGFRWTRESLNKYKELMQYEKYEDGKEYFILELKIK